MARRKNHDSFSKVLWGVFVVAFVLVLGVLFYATTQNTDNRSRAAREQITYNQWEFNGNTTEGWTASGASASVAGGFLTITAPSGSVSSTPPTFEQNAVGTTIPKGLKYVSVLLPDFPTGTPIPVRGDTTVKPVGIGFRAEIYYQTPADTTWRGPLVIQGRRRGSYTAQFPEIDALTVAKLRMNIVMLPSGRRLRIDAIRLTGGKGTSISPPGEGETVTKEGVVSYKPGISTASSYILTTAVGEKYSLLMGSLGNKESARDGVISAPAQEQPRSNQEKPIGRMPILSGTPTPKPDPLSTFVGKTVRVTGVIEEGKVSGGSRGMLGLIPATIFRMTPIPTLYIETIEEIAGGSGGKACTMDAKVCPDGSSVSRTGPNCEFAPCPSPLTQ